MAALKGVKTIDMVAGEITKVSYEGAEYERVKGEARVGDLVLNGRIHPDLTAGGFYEVIREEVTGWDSVKDDVGDYHSRVLGITKTAVFRKKKERLKVGDYAKVVEGSNLDEVDAGEIVKIIHDDYTQIPFKCDVIEGRRDADYIWAEESDLVLATEAEVAEAKAKLAPKFSVGDYAKVVGDTHYSDIVGGAIVKITDLADEDGDLRFELVGDGDYDYAKPSSLEKVSVEDADKIKEEASAKAKWAKIGRKVGEYKVGDIVAYDDRCWFGNSGIGEVVEGTYMNYQVRVAATDRGGFKNEYYLQKSRVTLITPVEARFDRS